MNYDANLKEIFCTAEIIHLKESMLGIGTSHVEQTK